MKHVQIRNNTYHYRRRIPKQLQDYFTTPYYHKSLSTDKNISTALSDKINITFSNAIVMIKLNMAPDLGDLNTCVPEPRKRTVSFADITTEYLKAATLSEARYKKVSYYCTVAGDLLTGSMNQNKLDSFKVKLSRLPKMNIHKYKVMPTSTLVQMDIPDDQLLSVKTKNDYIKTINSISKFAHQREFTDREFSLKLFAETTAPRDQRQSIDRDAIEQLITKARSNDLSLVYSLLYFSGMRLSEAYKCSVSNVDGVKCFDLTDRELKLKTSASYRVIPVHRDIDAESALDALHRLKSDYVTKSASKEFGALGSLYSLRHSFVDHLVKSGADTNVVSELAGHSHKTMTLSRYSKGFDVNQLKETIELI